MVEIEELKVSVETIYIDPGTDEIVANMMCGGSSSEIRTPLAECFDFEGDVRVTDDLNIEVRGNGWVRIEPVPDDLMPPEGDIHDK